ncbi:hypothetical protein HN789_01255 [archaeon]|jgi:hypothetical protein|nr:hypothetical protein [archaeon]MBT4022158.1 hypothetical protein [archaeon]MBT4272771.1 hypothetical protein [archaeon]MBT4461570.1 hypothetical protein [archaeon]MBT4857662.1 hypothetical protein [archaeon]
MKKIWIIIIVALGVFCCLASAAFVISLSTVTIKKPAVYLYPKEDMKINVQLDINGMLIEDIPKYNNGWNVFVTKEGIIENQYDYLFYEAKLKKISLPNTGWVIEYENLHSWFEINLPKLGLNKKEKTQFMDYWLNELPYSKYYEIKLLTYDFLEDNMNLIINPEPDTLIRLNFAFKPIKKHKILEEPEIKEIKRTGFTVIEWGGLLV